MSLTLVLVVLLAAAAAHGLITVGYGNDPVRDNDWPAGAVDVANLRTRVGWWEGPPFGGGQHTFLYRGDTAAFQQALDLFANVKAPELRLVVREGPHFSEFLKGADGARGKDPRAADAPAAGPPAAGKADLRVDWGLTVWNPTSFHRLYNNPQSTFAADDPGGNFRGTVEPPRLDVYVGGAPAGQGVDWPRVTVPANVRVTDERATAAGYAASAGSVLRGDAYDMVTSKPVAGARVAATKYAGQGERFDEVAAATADAAGHFELTGLAAGSYRVVASAGGYAPRVLGYATVGANTLKQYTVTLSPPAAVKGAVTDTAGRPVAGLTVRAGSLIAVDGRGYVLPARAEATTDAAGRFELAGVPRGHLHLTPQGTGYQGLDTLKLHPAPADDVALRVTATGTIRGRVVTAAGGPPAVPYIAKVVPEGGEAIGKWGGSATVEPDGTFAFDGVPPGKYTVTARPNPGPVLKGKDPAEKEVEVRAGQAAEVEIKGS